MEAEISSEIQRRAIEWHIRLRHGDDATWEAFADWLAEDPRHQSAYDDIENADLAIDPLLPDVRFHEAANDADDAGEAGAPPARGSPFRRWGVAGGALAASIAAAIALAPQFASSRYDVHTGPGERREIALDAATRVILNGSTRITLDHKDMRFASLDYGEALFHVRHDAARPFRLQVGGSRVEDVGTVFDVLRAAGEVRVAVGEGAVLYKSRGAATPLDAGQALTDRAGVVQVAATPADAVGGWQFGHFVYSGQPLSQVASDLSRSLGVEIAVVPALASRPFSGAIILDGSGASSDQRRRLAAALDVSLEAGPHGWTMKPRRGVAH